MSHFAVVLSNKSFRMEGSLERRIRLLEVGRQVGG